MGLFGIGSGSRTDYTGIERRSKIPCQAWRCKNPKRLLQKEQRRQERREAKSLVFAQRRGAKPALSRPPDRSETRLCRWLLLLPGDSAFQFADAGSSVSA